MIRPDICSSLELAGLKLYSIKPFQENEEITDGELKNRFPNYMGGLI